MEEDSDRLEWGADGGANVLKGKGRNLQLSNILEGEEEERKNVAKDKIQLNILLEFFSVNEVNFWLHMINIQNECAGCSKYNLMSEYNKGAFKQTFGEINHLHLS